MELDAGMFVAAGLCAAFFGAVVYAELHSRRQRRQAQGDSVAAGGSNLPPSTVAGRAPGPRVAAAPTASADRRV